jgi:hypothetical protein
MGNKNNPEDTSEIEASSEVSPDGTSKPKARTDLKNWLAYAPRGRNTSRKRRESGDSKDGS